LSIKVELNRYVNEPKPEYPRIMESTSSGDIYIMQSKSQGFRIVAKSNSGKLEFCTWLDNSILKDYHGKLEVFNE
jgi:hypothetical protein